MKSATVALLILLSTSVVKAETVCFSPGNNCDQIVIKAIKTAKSSIDLAVYSFTKPNIADALIVAVSSGVKVRVMLDRGESVSHYSQITRLQQAGIPVHIQQHLGLMHDKFVVIDKKKVLTGSFNWSNNATYSNDENLVSLDRLAGQYTTQFEKIFAQGK